MQVWTPKQNTLLISVNTVCGRKEPGSGHSVGKLGTILEQVADILLLSKKQIKEGAKEKENHNGLIFGNVFGIRPDVSFCHAAARVRLSRQREKPYIFGISFPKTNVTAPIFVIVPHYPSDYCLVNVLQKVIAL